MALFKNKLFKNKMVTVQKFRPVFTTVDGGIHFGAEYNYIISDRLRCSVPEYIMIDINSDGYIKDNRHVMYPLANIISIDWKLEDEKEIEDSFNEYRIVATKEEVERYAK